MSTRNELRNIAIVAHVDHGKTTLVDALFQQGGMYRKGQEVTERAMDSGDQERERGITILAKSTSVTFRGTTLQIVDTPGHADFGGEVERSLRMVDGILLLVDAAEGPLPQTRFVLRKALALGLPTLVAINKIDRQDARPEEVLDEVYDLFISLGATDEQIDFPVLYTVSRAGTATTDLKVPGVDLTPLVDAIVKTIPAPTDRSDEPFLMQVNSLGYDDYVGRLVVGRVLAGSVEPNQIIEKLSGAKKTQVRVTGLFRFQGVERLTQQRAECGDIIALSGMEDVTIGDTLRAIVENNPHQALAAIDIDEPTVAMIFQVNDGPLAGRSGGKFLTSRHVRQRLEREAFANVSIQVEDGETADAFRVMGRGELQLAVLIEAMRRELFEFCVRKPQVIIREGANGPEEPVERLSVDVPLEFMGPVTELLGRRHAKLVNQRQEGDRARLEYIIPTRGLLGARGTLMTTTRGTAIVHSVFEDWMPWSGPITQRAMGAIVSDREGNATPYALFHLAPRGINFVAPGTKVYAGMVVGEHNRDKDLFVNVVRPKKLTNVRASGKDEKSVVAPPREMTLERSLEWIRDDELVEITPDVVRIRKVDWKTAQS